MKSLRHIKHTYSIKCSNCGEDDLLAYHSTAKKHIKILDKENQIEDVCISIFKYRCKECGKITSSQCPIVGKWKRHSKKLVQYIQEMYDKNNKSALAVHALFQEKKPTYIPVSTIHDIVNERG